MKISEIDILPVKPNDGHVAFASLVIDEIFKVSDIGVYLNLDGSIRLRWPEKFVGIKKVTTFHPIKKDISDFIVSEVEKTYLALTENESKMRRNKNAKDDSN